VNTKSRTAPAAIEAKRPEFNGSVDQYPEEKDKQTRPYKLSQATLNQYRSILLDIAETSMPSPCGRPRAAPVAPSHGRPSWWFAAL